MSALAQILLARGEKVSGSDIERNVLLKKIQAQGGKIFLGHSSHHLDHAQVVVYSSSILPKNPELIAARNRGLPVVHRSWMVARLLSGRKVIAVTGAHGKSTTTALIAELLIQAKRDPTVLLGAELDSLKGNVRVGNGPHAVVEADESDGSLLWLNPAIAVITNIDEEHLDYFRNGSEILELFAGFAERVSPQGAVIGCSDNPGVRQLLRAVPRRQVTYGLLPGAVFQAVEISSEKGGSRYRCLFQGKSLGWIRLKIPGIHNVVNSLSAVGLAHLLKIGFPMVQAALEGYRGAHRRFEVRGQVNGIRVVEDYAHHPTEIEATLKAARSLTGDLGESPRRIRCVFQPHRYSRTKYLLNRFGSSFALADQVVLLPIYAASEEPLNGITSERLLKAIRATGKERVSLHPLGKVVDQLVVDSEPGDLILFMGAGSVGNLACKMVEALKRRFHGR